MELFTRFFELFLHLGEHLQGIFQNYGAWTYLLLFLIIFCETGLVMTPVLPGDSLLFAIGTFSANGSLKAGWAFFILSAAAVAGDTANYWIGYFAGPKVFHKEKVRFLNKKYLDRTHQFYEKYGGKTIILARFVPIVRTFAPFVAGIGRMTYRNFVTYNILGGVAWIAIFVFAGFYFGTLPFVKDHFTLIIYLIIAVSILPGVIEFFRQHNRPNRKFANIHHTR
jgi:membrane-associated protein